MIFTLALNIIVNWAIVNIQTKRRFTDKELLASQTIKIILSMFLLYDIVVYVFSYFIESIIAFGYYSLLKKNYSIKTSFDEITYIDIFFIILPMISMGILRNFVNTFSLGLITFEISGTIISFSVYGLALFDNLGQIIYIFIIDQYSMMNSSWKQQIIEEMSHITTVTIQKEKLK